MGRNSAAVAHQWHSHDLEVGGGSCGYLAAKIMHNFVYLAKLHEPLVKHEKNLGRSACLFAAELSTN